MKTLTDAQMQVLEAAAQVGGVTSTTKHHRTVASLIKQGLVIENDSDDGAGRLVATPAGLAMHGGSPAKEAIPAFVPARIATLVAPPELSMATDGGSGTLPEPRQAKEPQGKLGVLVGLLRQPGGATLAAMMAATGWQAHSVRGAMAGALKKKLGLTIVSEKSGSMRSWRIAEMQS